MGTYSSYYYYKKYVKYGNQDPLPVIPEEYSVDGDGTMPYLPKSENDPECGYTGETATYRWVNIDISVDYVCLGTSKYYMQKKQVSYDSGTTWSDVTPPEYQTGGLYETGSTDCGYIDPITDYKARIEYPNGDSKTIPCGNTQKLQQYEYRSIYKYSVPATAYVGTCVNELYQAFSNCMTIDGTTYLYSSYITDVVIPSTVTVIGYRAFYCQGILSGVNIPSSVTTIGEQAFSACESLTSIVIPDSVTSIGKTAFGNCTSLVSATISSAITSVPDSMFFRCLSLKNVTFRGVIRSIETGAFHNSGIETFVIPSTVTSIGVSAFQYCESLTSITIPEGVEYIGNYAFYKCSSLTSVTIPSTVEELHGNVFESCTSLSYAIVLPEVPPHIPGVAYSSKYMSPFEDTNNCPIYVPAASVNAYKTANAWKQYASRIFPIGT